MLILCVALINLRVGGPLVSLLCRLRLFGTEEYQLFFFQIRAKVDHLYHELESLDLDWDLIFLGRKILWNTHEPWVEGSQVLVHVNYTYWTLAYMLSQRGAQKLLDEKPLPKMVPGMFTNDTQKYSLWNLLCFLVYS